MEVKGAGRPLKLRGVARSEIKQVSRAGATRHEIKQQIQGILSAGRRDDRVGTGQGKLLAFLLDLKRNELTGFERDGGRVTQPESDLPDIVRKVPIPAYFCRE